MSSNEVTISRRDFYSSLAVVWMFIMIILHKQLIASPNNPGWQDYLIWGSALGMTFVYSAYAWKERRRLRSAPAAA